MNKNMTLNLRQVASTINMNSSLECGPQQDLTKRSMEIQQILRDQLKRTSKKQIKHDNRETMPLLEAANHSRIRMVGHKAPYAQPREKSMHHNSIMSTIFAAKDLGYIPLLQEEKRINRLQAQQQYPMTSRTTAPQEYNQTTGYYVHKHNQMPSQKKLKILNINLKLQVTMKSTKQTSVTVRDTSEDIFSQLFKKKVLSEQSMMSRQLPQNMSQNLLLINKTKLLCAPPTNKLARQLLTHLTRGTDSQAITVVPTQDLITESKLFRPKLTRQSIKVAGWETFNEARTEFDDLEDDLTFVATQKLTLK